MPSSVEDLVTSTTEKTFEFDRDLLTLPVPDLEETANKYLQSVRNHVSEEEYQQTEKIVKHFLQTDGQRLQQKLVEKGKTERNWLAKWWEDLAYLEARIPAPYMNMAGPGPYGEGEAAIWPAQAGSQLVRAALGLHLVLKVWSMLRRETYRPMRDGKKRPQDMFQFRRIFNTCTVPGVHRDKLEVYFKTVSEGDCPSHVLVTHKGHMFTIGALDESGDILTPPEILSQFEKIVAKCRSLGAAQGVNFLTSCERTAWAQSRSELAALHPDNFSVLEKIQKSILGVWLESGPGGDPTGKDELTALTQNSLLGAGENRWFDKSLNSGIYEDGLFISNGDHTPAEGMLMVYITDFVHKKLVEMGGKWQGTNQTRPQPEPEHLEFVLNENLREKIVQARNQYQTMRGVCNAQVFRYTKYGKNFCKLKRQHPDAVCQLAFHRAYYSLTGKMAPGYETAPTKQFYRGRTETLRSCTRDNKIWCQAMDDPSVSNAQRCKLFTKAVSKHLHDFVEACEGRGIDRHLLGLFALARDEGKIPEIFTDPSFSKSGGGGNYILSTSCIGYTSVLGGVLPMCENGYGCFYRINDNQLTFYVTSWNADSSTDNQSFGAAIFRALDEIGDLLESTEKRASARL